MMPSNFDEKNAIVFWGQYPGSFETKFFPLRFEGTLYNSAVTIQEHFFAVSYNKLDLAHLLH